MQGNIDPIMEAILKADESGAVGSADSTEDDE